MSALPGIIGMGERPRPVKQKGGVDDSRERRLTRRRAISYGGTLRGALFIGYGGARYAIIRPKQLWDIA